MPGARLRGTGDSPGETFLPLLGRRILLLTPQISPKRWCPPLSSDFSPKPPQWDMSPRRRLGEKKVREKARLVEGVAGGGTQASWHRGRRQDHVSMRPGTMGLGLTREGRDRQDPCTEPPPPAPPPSSVPAGPVALAWAAPEAAKEVLLGARGAEGSLGSGRTVPGLWP